MEFKDLPTLFVSQQLIVCLTQHKMKNWIGCSVTVKGFKYSSEVVLKDILKIRLQQQI